MLMGDAQKPVKTTPLQVARAVFWSFFGIRKRAEYERDAVSLTLPQDVNTVTLSYTFFEVEGKAPKG